METLKTLLDALAPLLEGFSGDVNTAFDGISTDTRTVKPGNAFLALSGERFDGHAFAADAVRAGAVAVILSRPNDDLTVPQIIVRDTGLAYGLSAKAWRSRFAIPMTVVAGSNGKTTTTQMLASILKKRWGADRVCATIGNFNNEVGVPRMLWSLGFEHRGAVFECGMNHPGEMARLADWTRPTVALLTNAQREHQEFLKSVEATAHENGLVIVSLPETGIAVYPADDVCTQVWADLAMARGVQSLTYATACEADVTGRVEEGVLTLCLPEETLIVPFALQGEHNLHNALGAAAAAVAMGIDAESIAAGLAAFDLLPGRGARSTSASGVLTVIDDAYNANPDSVRASMKVLAVEPGPRTFVLGDMGEVGEEADAVHREVGAFAKQIGIDALWTSGPRARLAAEAFGEGARWFETREALIDALRGITGTVTVKASHSMGFDAVVKALKEE